MNMSQLVICKQDWYCRKSLLLVRMNCPKNDCGSPTTSEMHLVVFWFTSKSKEVTSSVGMCTDWHHLISDCGSASLSRDMSQILGGRQNEKLFHIFHISCFKPTLRKRQSSCLHMKSWELKIEEDVRFGPKGDTASRGLLSQRFNGVTHWPDCIVRPSLNSNSLFVMTAVLFWWGVLVRQTLRRPRASARRLENNSLTRLADWTMCEGHQVREGNPYGLKESCSTGHD